MRKKNKQVSPKATNRPDRKHVPQRATPPRDNKPSWRFSTVDHAKDSPFRWPKGEPDEMKIIKDLHNFDSMTWNEIEGRRNHQLTPKSLSPVSIKRLKARQLDDCIENLFSFRLSGPERVVCIKDGHIAKLLWYDPEHKVCPSQKKHT